MKATILSKFEENQSTCFLVNISLEEYISGLPKDYKSYEVQREIVKNTYLDNLVMTIINHQHIPPIVLVVEDENIKIKDDYLEISEYKILDGLQRTFRLKIIFDTIKILTSLWDKESASLIDMNRLTLSKKFKEQLSEIDGDSLILYRLKEFAKEKGKSELENLFKRNQWFEVWHGLSSDKEVEKMLILNAGHKPVKTKHQLELLFRNILPILQKVDFPTFNLVREKDVSSIQYSKDRTPGQFHFSHIITAILSLNEGKPQTTNTNLIQKSQTDSFNDEVFDKFLNLDFLKDFIKSLLEIDTAVTQRYQEKGVKWMGRETSLAGMFAATGKLIHEKNIAPREAIAILRDKIVENPNLLNLDQFEEQRNSLDLAKINIGNVNKTAVYDGIYSILIESSQSINWAVSFKTI